MDVESLAKQLILQNMTPEQQKAVLESIRQSLQKTRELKKQKVGENAQLVVQALKKIEADIRAKYDDLGNKIEQRVASIKDGKDGKDGKNGANGRDGRDGMPGPIGPKGKDGLNGRDGKDGEDGVSVTDAHIDFDGSLIISLSSGRTINVGEVVAPDLTEKIKIIANGGGTSQTVLDTLASLQTQINNLIPSQTGNNGKFLSTNGSSLSWASVPGALTYKGTWNASTNTPTLASGVGFSGDYYVVATAGSTNLDGITDWLIGDWLLFNGATWQKIDQTNTVTSVNGQTGAVSLTTTNINEGTNLYYLDSRARQALSAGTGITYDNTTGVITNAAPDQVVSLSSGTGISTSGTYPSFTITNSAPDQVVALTAGTGISTSGTYPNFTITNSAPDQTVALTASTGISVSGTYPNFTITNSAPDQTVSLTGAGTTSISGTYPNFTITSNDQYQGTVTSVGVSVPTGLSVSNTPITSSGTIAIALASGYSIPTTSSQTNWDTAYTDRLKWDGGSTGLNATTGRTSLGLGTIATQDANNVSISGGTINGTSIGATTASSGAFTSITSTSASGVLTRQAATQDGVQLLGRAGGTSSWEIILTPTTLSADRTLTLPDVSGTVVTTGDSGTVTSTMIADGTIVNGDISASAAIAVSKLSASTISGVTLGNNLATLTMNTSGTGLSGSTTYNGSGAATFTVASNATNANTASTIVARDASGNFSAGTITATLSGNATNVTGTVAVANGGTGSTSLTANNVLLGNGTSALQVVAPGANGNVLTSNGTTWVSSTPTSGGSVTSVAQTFTGGLISVSGSPITTSGTLALTVAGTSGGVPYFSSASTWASSGVLTANAIVVGGGAGSAPSTITTGTGVVTALGVNTGSAGAFVVNGGALGTPSSGTVTNLTGTASININGTVGATTANSGAFTTISATGVTTVQAGTASAPAITTSGDTNTGIYFPGADRIGFAEGGAQCGEFDASGNFKFNSGYGSVETAYGCRAWVNFNGTGTVAIRASGNVTSITDNGTGDYTVNFTTAMPDANYVACATSVQRQTASGTNQSVGYYSTDDVNATTYSTTAVRISTKIGSVTGFIDTNIVSVAIFR